MNIREIRKRRGLSAGRVAELAGYASSQMSQWENGKISPGVPVLVRLAEVLDCTLDELVGRDTAAS